VNDEIGKAVTWADAHRDEVAKLYAEASGVPYEAQKRTVERSDFAFSSLTDAVVTRQQAVADRFHRVGLIPKPIVVRDIVWRPKSA
jgi:ABC-type nitrate/sulfonate/bicarbonate transport system substrate-binding protein